MKLRVPPALLAAIAAMGLATSARAIVGGTPTTDFKATGIGLQVTDNWVLTVQQPRSASATRTPMATSAAPCWRVMTPRARAPFRPTI